MVATSSFVQTLIAIRECTWSFILSYGNFFSLLRRESDINLDAFHYKKKIVGVFLGFQLNCITFENVGT